MLLCCLSGFGAAGGCGDKSRSGGEERTGGLRIPGPSERLHPPGELRLTSAGNPPRLRLRYRFAPGQWNAYRTAISASFAGATGSGQVRATVDWERRVEQVAGSGAQLRVRVRRVRTVRPSVHRQQLLSRLLSVGYTEQVDPRGRVTALRPGDALGAEITPQSITRLSVPLPEDPVGNGAMWERDETWRTAMPRGLPSPLIQVRVRYALRLLARRGRGPQAEIAATLRMAVASDGEARPRIRASGEGTARLLLDVRAGIPLRGRSEATYRLHLGRTDAPSVVTLRSKSWKIRIPKAWRRSAAAP